MTNEHKLKIKAFMAWRLEQDKSPFSREIPDWILTEMEKEQQNREHESYEQWLNQNGYELNHLNYEEMLQTTAEWEMACNGSRQMATYTEANEQEFAELCQHYNQTLSDVEKAGAAQQIARTNLEKADERYEEANDHLKKERWKMHLTEERLKAYALLFGFALPGENEMMLGYVGEESIPF